MTTKAKTSTAPDNANETEMSLEPLNVATEQAPETNHSGADRIAAENEAYRRHSEALALELAEIAKRYPDPSIITDPVQRLSGEVNELKNSMSELKELLKGNAQSQQPQGLQPIQFAQQQQPQYYQQQMPQMQPQFMQQAGLPYYSSGMIAPIMPPPIIIQK